MNTAIKTLTLAAAALAIAAAATVYSGAIDVAADAPHSAAVEAVLEIVRERSIARRAQDIEAPALDDQALIRSGAGNYQAMCVGCHLAPGLNETELSASLYPAPPNLAAHGHGGDPARAFWIIKHGIKASGMPAWGQSMGDDYIWGLVAFLEQMPGLDAQQYRDLVAASGGHQHGGGESGMHDHSDQHHAAPASEPTPAGLEAPQAGEIHRHADGSEHRH
ncbi:c-type cytochrome [Stutzerimonas balearica]|uniref:c-type cytochrome n=1 Tax=Stutzerimonas balearica TaxID=74829 RepID=UPI0028A2B833|nr:cytochrome c [Stutzerimonas balearica]